MTETKTTDPGRPRSLWGVLVTVLIVVAGCGPAGSSGSGVATTGDRDAGTVTITHRYGDTEVPVNPARIVSLDNQWTDALAALGHAPVAYLADPSVPDGMPWRDADLKADATLKATTALPFEQIAAQHPDLIVVSYFADSKASYDKLAAIAPTVASLGEGSVDTWQDITRAAGKILGEPDEADAVIDRVEGDITTLGDELPGLAGKTVAMAYYVAGDGIYVVADPNDGSMGLFEQLGLSISPTITGAGNIDQGRVKLSFENVSMLDADLLILLLSGAETDDITGYGELPAVKSGAVAELDYAAVSALNTPSPLSIPWVLDKIRPALTKAAGS